MIGVCQETPWNTSGLSKSHENKAYAAPGMFNMLLTQYFVFSTQGTSHLYLPTTIIKNTYGIPQVPFR
jgi:hypothetical protein